MIFCIIPFDRQEFADNVHATVQRLAAPDVRFVVVCNGGADYGGDCDELAGIPEREVSAAMNLGLTIARETSEPGDWFARLDSDDAYESHYLDEIRKVAKQGADWTGIPRKRVKGLDGSEYVHGDPDRFICLGGTLAGRLDIAAPWEPQTPYQGDDTRWCAAMAERGLKFIPRGPDAGFTWVRREGSLSSSVPDVKLRNPPLRL